LRGAFVPLLDDAFTHDAGGQPASDQFEPSFVVDISGEFAHQDVMVDSIKAFTQIEVDHPVVSFPDVFLRGT
jgi:hypothetical protein